MYCLFFRKHLVLMIGGDNCQNVPVFYGFNTKASF